VKRCGANGASHTLLPVNPLQEGFCRGSNLRSFQVRTRLIENSRIRNLCGQGPRTFPAQSAIQNRNAVFYLFKCHHQMTCFRVDISQEQITPSGIGMLFTMTPLPEIQSLAVSSQTQCEIIVEQRLPTLVFILLAISNWPVARYSPPKSSSATA
jgi:hypothetical protein